MAFKMKRTPIKGLADFFSSLGKQATAGQKDRGIFSEKGKAEKKERKAGESKFQADVRRRKETKKTTKAKVNTTAPNPKDEVKIDPRVGMDRYTYTDAGDTKKVNTKKVKTKFSGSGTDARKKQYDAEGWKYDDTIKGYNRDGTEKKKGKFRVQLMVGEQNISADILRSMSKLGNINKTKQGTDMYKYHTPDFETQEEADAYLAEAKLSGFENAFIPSPVPKKSPSKKRGYKMKRK